ncbi:hypothetical protein LUX39_34505 [Actinomadura madurae]|nr:hypothetical protein [Actinomadura madurae]MCQ0006439.1 hypothetical protein [Actinomadura madurae]MCQ0018272.1 hypothetical protein [Actinomadura madurae]
MAAAIGVRAAFVSANLPPPNEPTAVATPKARRNTLISAPEMPVSSSRNGTM